MPLSIEAYDAAEQEAKCGLSFAEIMAFAPQTFEKLGFPHRVKDERELVRYADWNRDAGNQQYFWPNHFFGGPAVETKYTLDEIEVMDRVRDQAVEVTRKMGRAVRPLCGPFAQLGLFRIIQTLRTNYFGKDAVSVFEVGPGTGYLGAMLINRGDRYSCMDNAQALYLWQERLLSPLGAQCVPWWQFLRTDPLPADIVVSNTNLGEMTGDALKIVIYRAKQMLQNSPGLFVFINIGAPMHNDDASVKRELEKAGFVHLFGQLFQGYMLADSGHHVLPGMRLDRIPLYNPSRRAETKSGKEACYLPDDQRPLDLDVTQILEGWEPPVRKAP